MSVTDITLLLSPEITVDVDGVYWHPVGPTADLLISRDIFPLRAAALRGSGRYRPS